MLVLLQVEYLFSEILWTRNTSEVLELFSFKNICVDFIGRPPLIHRSEIFTRPEIF